MGIQLQVAPPVDIDMSPNAPLPVYTPNPSFQDIQFSSHPQPRYVTTVAEEPESVESHPQAHRTSQQGDRYQNSGTTTRSFDKTGYRYPLQTTRGSFCLGLIRSSDESSSSSTTAVDHFAITGCHPTNRVNRQFEHSIASRAKCIIIVNTNTSTSKSLDTPVSPPPVYANSPQGIGQAHTAIMINDQTPAPAHAQPRHPQKPYALEDIQFSNHPRPNVAIVIQADENTTTCGSTMI
ncbi:hypothetical protein EC957_001611 [Mortierella hygrophila]|uniref:Uncharacterized protein n=1 Tax=Mortierella hygrophila TaxID=979708 RepID=A0A9P6K7N4_9FUNG|nr:hypothetical protein EC957_001611 [Mortierella hygrophila]